MENTKRFLYETRPLALAENIVSGNNYRFTILTPSLIRLEFSEDGIFEDRASQFAFFRDFAETKHTNTKQDGWLTLETSNLILRYKENEPFSENTLCITLKMEPASTWHFGDDFDDLGGTARTLDRTNGPTTLDRGVCSRYGFSLIDDCNTIVLNEEGWVEARYKNTSDYYFWGYGYEYKAAIKDLYRLTGVTPLLPAYALGNWWSRYHAYTQEEYQNLIERFEKENIPFSVSVVDMDWHITKIPEELKDEDTRFTSGWTGYTWNRELFPDYKAFLSFLHEHKLKTALNLHPAQGIGRHEEMYEKMALACGIDPATQERVKFDVLSPNFMNQYFDILHHPYEEDGVDFWWMDWQQGTNYWWIHEANTDGNLHDEREVLDPLWMLNHLHIADIKRNGLRPMFFSRYSGTGSHRYPIGFSGDTLISWEALDYQPYFTSTASNIGYSWWSHDIGGHMRSYQNDELMVRWLQYGVFSPINRLHSSNEQFSGKEPWNFGFEAEHIMKDWLHLRHKLFPYIYTMNYRSYADLEPIVQPMYYDYPKRNAAYEQKNQYMFGSELMVAPITKPNNTLTRMGSTDVWLPSGDWFDFFSGLHYTSTKGRTIKVHRSLNEYPVFAKAGAIIPMQDSDELTSGNDLEIYIFPGKSNSFTLYEDAGDGSGFESGEYVQTTMDLNWSEIPTFTIAPSKGELSLLPNIRNYKLILKGYHKDISANVYVDGKRIAVTGIYDADKNSMILSISANVSSQIRVEIIGDSFITDNGDINARCIPILQKMQLEYDLKLDALKKLDLDAVEMKKSSCPSYTRLERAIYNIYMDLSRDVEYNELLTFLKEQLILTNEDYTN